MGSVLKEHSNMEITIRISKHAGYECAGNRGSVYKKQACRVQMCRKQGTDIYFQCLKLSKQVFHTVFAVSRK
jgi:hypothetical protein